MSFTLINVSIQNRNLLCAGGPRFNSRQGLRAVFFPLRRQDRFWARPARFRVFPGRQSGRRVKAITVLHLMQRLLTYGAAIPISYTTHIDSRLRDKCRPTCVINGWVNLVKKISYTVFKILPDRMLHIHGFFSSAWDVFFFSRASLRILYAVFPLPCTDIQWNLNFVASLSKCVSADMKISRLLPA
jgi:hypothetical protein